MEDRETARMRKYGESKTTRIMMTTVPHVISGLGLRKFQADGFLLTRVYKSAVALCSVPKLAERLSFVEYKWRVAIRCLQVCSLREEPSTGTAEQIQRSSSTSSTRHKGDTVTVYSCVFRICVMWDTMNEISSDHIRISWHRNKRNYPLPPPSTKIFPV